MFLSKVKHWFNFLFFREAKPKEKRKEETESLLSNFPAPPGEPWDVEEGDRGGGSPATGVGEWVSAPWQLHGANPGHPQGGGGPSWQGGAIQKPGGGGRNWRGDYRAIMWDCRSTWEWPRVRTLSEEGHEEKLLWQEPKHWCFFLFLMKKDFDIILPAHHLDTTL